MDRLAYDPTPEEIAERSAEVRRGWTRAVERKRLVVKIRRVEIQIIEVPPELRDIGQSLDLT